MKRIAIIMKKNNYGAQSSKIGYIGIVERKEGDWGKFSISNLCKQSYMTFLVILGLALIVIQVNTKGILLK